MIQKLSMILVVFCLFGFVSVEAQVTVKGTVSDANNGGPIPGVNITEKGTSKGVVSDFDGNYSIEVSSGATLRFSYVGYATQDISVSGKTALDVAMVEQSEGLNEVIVVGYGTQKKGNLTGAISTIDAEVLEDRPVSNVMQAIQGSAPGLQLSVGNSGGSPGSSMNISIRGVGNLQGTGAPLVIVGEE